MSPAESQIRADERTKCWEEIASMIREGELTYGDDAERNGLIRAANCIAARQLGGNRSTTIALILKGKR